MMLARNHYHKQRQPKSMLFAYLLWVLFGFFGAHRFYLGRISSANAMLILGAVGASRLTILMNKVNAETLSQISASAALPTASASAEMSCSPISLTGVEEHERTEQNAGKCFAESQPSTSPTPKFDPMDIYRFRSKEDLLNYILPLIVILWIYDGFVLHALVHYENDLKMLDLRNQSRVKLQFEDVKPGGTSDRRSLDRTTSGSGSRTSQGSYAAQLKPVTGTVRKYTMDDGQPRLTVMRGTNASSSGKVR